MGVPLRVLLIEDSEDDAALLLRELRRGGYEPAWERVETATALGAALVRHDWDLITCDYVMPQFSAPAALRLIQGRGIDVPVIIVSGEVGEEVAVTAMKGGAHDYVSKHQLARLLPAIERELRDAEVRRARKRAEEGLRAMAHQYRRLVETSQDLIWSVDREGRITFCNPAVVRILGYTPEECLGRRFTDFLPATAAKRVPPFQRVQGAEIGYDSEVLVLRKDGSEAVLRFNVAALHDDDGNVVGMSGTAADVTARKRAEEAEARLRQAQKLEAIGRLAGGVAHDFNNQLTVIKGSLQLLVAKLPADDPRRLDAERIRAGVDRSAGLARQLLTFGRRQPLQTRWLDLNALVHETAPMLRLLLGEQFTLRLETAPRLWPVRADRSQIEQVLMNLVSNAKDAMAPGTVADATVTLQTANADLDERVSPVDGGNVVPGAYVMLAVRDNGAGMTPAVQEHIFEPFFTTKEVGKGTGLGLATVFGIVKQHGGYIACATASGLGTTIQTYFPRDPSVPAAAPGDTPAVRELVAAHHTVLVVEDEANVRELMTEALEHAGYRVHGAADAEAALALAESSNGPIDLLISDVVMPGEGGPSLARRLAQAHPALRVLFISGYLADRLDLSELAAARFLNKPFDLDTLLRMVRELLAGQIQ